MAIDRDLPRQLTHAFLDQVDRALPGRELTPESRLRLSHVVERELATQLGITTQAKSQRVTILLSDLRGFTQMSEQFPPADVIGLLNRYFTKMNSIIHDHQGVIDKFMGDAIMVLFGVPEERDDDLLRAIRCATRMQRAMDEINQGNRKLDMPELFMGIGINTGEVVAGNVGSAVHSEFTVIGDQVNLASRVEAHSLRGQVLLSENSFSLAEEAIEVAPPRRVYIKGKRDPVNLYELRAVTRPDLLEVPNREVRRGPRVEVDFPFQFQAVQGKGIAEDAHQGHALDLSYSGLRGRVAFSVEQMSDLKLKLAGGMLAGEAEEIYAKVLTVVPQEQGCEVTMEFTSMPLAVNEVIRRYVDRIVEGG